MAGAQPDVDVAIVGAGPAGAASALTLARAGRRVLLVDRATFPRDKTCGDGLTTSALRELEHLGLDLAEVPSLLEVADVHVSSPSGHVVTYPLPRSDGMFAAVARRLELDDALVDLAAEAGAEVITGAACTGADQLGDRIRVEIAGRGAVEASWLLGADGMWSPTRRFLGVTLPDYRGDWHAMRHYVRDVGPRARRDLHIWFEPDILPGYVWSFPLADGGANVGFGVRRGTSWRIGALGQLWRELLTRPHIRAVLGDDAKPEGPTRAWPIPARVDRIPLATGRALWIGDAAAATDPMTGEGIGQALLTGRWAAEAILGEHGAAQVRHRYETTVRRDLALDHRLADLLTRALAHRKGARVAVWMSGLTPWTRQNFARWLFEDYPRAVLATPRRWGPGMLSGHGAYRSAPEGSPSRNVDETHHS